MRLPLTSLRERNATPKKVGWGPGKNGICYLLFNEAWESVLSYLGIQLGCTKEEFLEHLLSQGLAQQVTKEFEGQSYEVLAIRAEVMGRFLK